MFIDIDIVYGILMDLRNAVRLFKFYITVLHILANTSTSSV